MTNSVKPLDPVPSILEGFTLEQKLEIVLYASQQYNKALPRVKSDYVKTVFQKYLQFCTDFVDMIGDYISNGYKGDFDFDGLQKFFKKVGSDYEWIWDIHQKIPKKDKILAGNKNKKIIKFADNIAKKTNIDLYYKRVMDRPDPILLATSWSRHMEELQEKEYERERYGRRIE